VTSVRTLVPINVHPVAAPLAWEALAGSGPDATAVIDIAKGPGTGRDPYYTRAISRLAGFGVGLLGYIDLGFATRPVDRILADVGRWAGYPVNGVFLDRAPASPFAIGPAAVAIQMAHRVGFTETVLNPGGPPDPSYRRLPASICVFDGTWEQYRAWSCIGHRPGDGHVVHGVPPRERSAAHDLVAARGAGFAMLTTSAYTWGRRGLGWQRGQENDERFMNGSRRTARPHLRHGSPALP
jgi:hypothetical protein